jgi:hypothetical protein
VTALRGVWWVGSILLLAACAPDGTKTGNGVQMEFVVNGEALTQADGGAAQPLLVEDKQGTSFLIDEAVLIVSQLELRAKDEDLCAFELSESLVCTNGRLRLRQNLELDLLAPRTNSVLRDLVFPAVVYDRVEVRTQALNKDSALGPVSFYLSGQVTVNERTNAFVVSLKRNETLRFEALEGVNVREGQWLSAQIDVRAWFEQLPLTDCITAGDVTLEQDTWQFTEQSKCKEIESTFVDALRQATRLRKNER